MKEISVNMTRNLITVKEVNQRKIFNEDGFFVIEADEIGYSRIEKEDNKYYYRNYLGRKRITNREMNAREVAEYIKEIIGFEE